MAGSAYLVKVKETKKNISKGAKQFLSDQSDLKKTGRLLTRKVIAYLLVVLPLLLTLVLVFYPSL